MVTVLALTGEPGAGKSTAAAWFVKRGAALLDADAAVRELWDGEELPALARDRWGEKVFAPDGKIDKRAVSGIIFSDTNEYSWLCGVIYPKVFEKMMAKMPKDGLVIAEIPMLFESGRPDWVDKVLFMRAGAQTRADRNSFRGLDETELARRGKFFIDSDERAKMSDWVIVNDGTLEQLEEKLLAVWSELTQA